MVGLHASPRALARASNERTPKTTHTVHSCAGLAQFVLVNTCKNTPERHARSLARSLAFRSSALGRARARVFTCESLCVCVCVICNSSVIVLFGCVLVVSLFTYDCRSRCSCVYAACSRRVHDWRASPSRPKTLTRGRLHRSRWQCHLEYSTAVVRTTPTGAAAAQLSAWIPRGADTQHSIGTLKHTHTHQHAYVTTAALQRTHTTTTMTSARHENKQNQRPYV